MCVRDDGLPHQLLHPVSEWGGSRARAKSSESGFNDRGAERFLPSEFRASAKFVYVTDLSGRRMRNHIHACPYCCCDREAPCRKQIRRFRRPSKETNNRECDCLLCLSRAILLGGQTETGAADLCSANGTQMSVAMSTNVSGLGGSNIRSFGALNKVAPTKASSSPMIRGGAL
jgi:hypothetical protein